MLETVYTHLYSATGAVNDTEWNGNSAYTMLFMGGEVPQTGKDRWMGTFLFVYDSGLHDYPWFRINTKTQQVDSDPYWSEIYPSYDFSKLELHKTTI
jgi:hypothetical protein